MKTIWKYPLPIDDAPMLTMPQGAKILCVQPQGDQLVCIWAIVDPESPVEMRRFRIIGTGHRCEDELMNPNERAYIGTFQLHGGALVFHLFEALTLT